jgi:tetratricopeptide (TPR) repeat protein
MKTKISVLLCIFLLTSSLFSQVTDKDKARWKGEEGMKLLDKGLFLEGLQLLRAADELDPEAYEYRFGIAYANYFMMNYNKTADILLEIINHKNVDDRLYQILGNSYCMLGNYDKGYKTYEDGLKKFPNSSRLYLEKGVYMKNKDLYVQALGFFEKGIELDPNFASNYFWAAIIFLHSDLRVFGLLYGELFMNLERSTERTLAMSEMLYETYVEEFEKESDFEKMVTFGGKKLYTSDDPEENKRLYFKTEFDFVMNEALIGIKDYDLNTISKIRTRFLTKYIEKGDDKKYNISLYEYMKQIKDAGHLEAYNHWILMKGDERDFKEWYGNNEKKFQLFGNWFKDNKLILDSSSTFVSRNYR